MKNIILLICSLCICLSSVHADSFEDFLEQNFEGGNKAFFTTFAQSIKYPSKARDHGIMGQVQTKLYVNAKGEMHKLEFLNELGYGIETEVAKVLNLMKDKWTKSDSDTERTIDFIVAFQLGAETVIEGDIKITAAAVPDFLKEHRKPLKTNEELEKKLQKHLKKERFKKAMEVCEELLFRVPSSEQYKAWEAEIQERLKE